jgi:hypothetical protein
VAYTQFRGEVIAEVGTITDTTGTSIDATGHVSSAETGTTHTVARYHTGILVASCPGHEVAGEAVLDPATIRAKW